MPRWRTERIPKMRRKRARRQTAGQAIRAARKAAGITQTELAGRLGWAQANVSAYERDERSPGVAILGEIGRVLGLAAIVTPGDVRLVDPASVRLPPEGD